MQAVLGRETLLERRHSAPEPTDLWNKLTLSQKFAASSLTQMGYDLMFIRSSRAGSVAVLQNQHHVTATISDEGQVNTSPEITVRQ